MMDISDDLPQCKNAARLQKQWKKIGEILPRPGTVSGRQQKTIPRRFLKVKYPGGMLGEERQPVLFAIPPILCAGMAFAILDSRQQAGFCSMHRHLNMLSTAGSRCRM